MTLPKEQAGPPRWRGLLTLSEQELTAFLLRRVRSVRELGFESACGLGARANLCGNEVGASPFATLAVAMGVEMGASHVHRELTRLPAFNEAKTADERHDVWIGGALSTGKYQAFLHEGAHSIFDPSHLAKWGPHEMMHRACGVYFCESDGAFDRYLAARLNELLPVALWYGFDQVARLDEGAFVRHKALREVGEAPFWSEPESTLEARLRQALPRFQWALRYAEQELAAWDREASSRRLWETRVEIGAATLNASSDALAYEVAHGARLRRPEVAQVLQRYAHFAKLETYRRHIEARLDTLLFASPEVLVSAALGSNGESRAAGPAPRERRDAWHGELMATLAPEHECVDGLHALDYGQLAEGIEICAPAAFDVLEATGETWLERFAESDGFWSRAPLVVRLSRFLQSEEGADLVACAPTVSSTLGFARALHRVTFDRCAEELAASSGPLLARSRAFEVVEIFHDFDEPELRTAPRPIALGIRSDEGLISLALSQEVAEFLEELGEDEALEEDVERRIGPTQLEALLTCGVLYRRSELNL